MLGFSLVGTVAGSSASILAARSLNSDSVVGENGAVAMIASYSSAVSALMPFRISRRAFASSQCPFAAAK